MADLVFSTRGQAEALAAQEQIAKSARETKRVFEEGVKATQAWDAAQQALKRSAESALRSVTTEQEKIVQQIEKIKASYRGGMTPKPEAEEGIKRLRQRWVDVDNAINEHKRNLNTVPKAIENVERPASALQNTFAKAFDPKILVRYAASFVGIQAGMRMIREEVEDIQTGIDKRANFFLEPLERMKSLQQGVASQRDTTGVAHKGIVNAAEQVALARQQDADRRRDIQGQIADEEKELAKARAEAEQKRRERISQATLGLNRAHEDQLIDPDSLAVRRRVADAERRLAQAGELDTPGTKAIESRLAKLRGDLTAPGEGVTAALARQSDARLELQRESQKLAELERQRSELRASPEYQRAEARGSVGTTADTLRRDLLKFQDATALSATELDGLADAFRDAGVGSMERKLRNFSDRLDAGGITIDEVSSNLREEADAATRAADKGARHLRKHGEGREFDIGGTIIEATTEDINRNRATAEALRKAAESLENAAKRLNGIDGGIPVDGT